MSSASRLSTARLGALAALALLSTLWGCGYFNLYAPLVKRDTETSTIVVWEKSFGGSGDDQGRAVRQTPDGGYLVAGHTTSFGAGGSDVWLLRTDEDGNELWSKTYGGAGDDAATAMAPTDDGGYLVVGQTNSFGAGGSDLWLLRVDAAGEEVWKRTYGGPYEEYDPSVQPGADGTFLVAASVEDEVVIQAWLLVVDADGEELASHTYGEGVQHIPCAALPSPGGGYVVAGTTCVSAQELPLEQFFLLRADADGTELWCQHYGGDYTECALGAVKCTGGGYAIAGSSRTFTSGDFDAWLLKTDADGEVQWDENFGGGKWDEASCVRQTADGGYILAGTNRSEGPWKQAWVVKADSTGEEQWEEAFGGLADDSACAVQETAGGGYIVTGYSEKPPHDPDHPDYDLYLVYCEPDPAD